MDETNTYIHVRKTSSGRKGNRIILGKKTREENFRGILKLVGQKNRNFRVSICQWLKKPGRNVAFKIKSIKTECTVHIWPTLLATCTGRDFHHIDPR